MNVPKLAIAMNYIDENLISGAIDYKPIIPSKKVTLFKKHIVAVAACLCVIVMAVTFALQMMLGRLLTIYRLTAMTI